MDLIRFRLYFSYKQQHQIFVQHASQQIAILDTQKQSLKGQPQNPSQASQQPTQPPPSDQPQLSLLPNECDSISNNQNNLNGGTNNFIANNRNDNRPPPLMSQNISMPRSGINPNYISSQQQRINYPGENSFQVSERNFVKIISFIK